MGAATKTNASKHYFAVAIGWSPQYPENFDSFAEDIIRASGHEATPAKHGLLCLAVYCRLADSLSDAVGRAIAEIEGLGLVVVEIAIDHSYRGEKQ